MPSIGYAEFSEIYRLAKLVDAGALSEREAGDKIVDSLGMNYSSAMGYLRMRRHLLAGETYTRTMNLPATRYFLKEILSDRGSAGLEAALRAVSGHISYYRGATGANTPGLLALVEEFQPETSIPLLRELQTRLEQDVARSRNLSAGVRQELLPPIGHLPEKIIATTIAYRRNPHVVAEVLERADGQCERCERMAPFIKKSGGSPYLEVHHKMMLSEGGSDTVDNAEALCPNCHRQQHFG